MNDISENPALEDFVEFLSKLAPRKLLEYKASNRTQERLQNLLTKNKESALNAAELRELEDFMMIEHLVRMAKARALQKLNSQAT